MLELIRVAVMTVVAANGFTGTLRLSQNSARLLQRGHRLCDCLRVGVIQVVEIDRVAHGQSEIHADLTFLIVFGMFRRTILICQRIVIDRFVVIASLVFHISEIVRRHIVLAEREIGQEILGDRGIAAAVVAAQEFRVDEAPEQNENSHCDHKSTDGEEDPANYAEHVFDLLKIRIHHATPPL